MRHIRAKLSVSARQDDRHEVLVVQSAVRVLAWARVEVFYYVVRFGLEKVMVTVFDEELLDLLAADVALILPINPRERRVWLKCFECC